jgi:hypothetical protein
LSLRHSCVGTRLLGECR